jgi:tRNA threonylcarbamoyladenosine biosynthesis protein TsaB
VRILAIETATSIGSAALLADDEVVAESESPGPMRHLEWLMPAINDMLDSVTWRVEDVEGLAVSRGPGSFTGLRIGMATAAVWARARVVPVVGVSTLETIAAGVADAAGAICVLLDARQGQYAGAIFAGRGGGGTRLTDDLVGDLSTILEMVPSGGSVTFAGDALEHTWPEMLARFSDRAAQAPRDQWTPRARVVGRLGLRRLAAGDRDDPYLLLPAYTRSPVRE